MLKHHALPLIPMEQESKSQPCPSHQCCLQECCDICNTNMSKTSVQQSTDLCLSDEHSQDLLQRGCSQKSQVRCVMGANETLCA